MKEVLTKSFWQGVKKTFYEAMESPPAKEDTVQTPRAAADKAQPSPSETQQAEETGS